MARNKGYGLKYDSELVITRLKKFLFTLGVKSAAPEIFDFNGRPISIDDLNSALNQIKSNYGRPNTVFMSSKDYEKIKKRL